MTFQLRYLRRLSAIKQEAAAKHAANMTAKQDCISTFLIKG